MKTIQISAALLKVWKKDVANYRKSAAKRPPRSYMSIQLTAKAFVLESIIAHIESEQKRLKAK